MFRNTYLVLLALTCFFIIKSMLPKAHEDITTKTANHTNLQDLDRKIYTNAIHPITAKFYPKWYDEWGGANIAKINSLMKPAALYAATKEKCDYVEGVSLSGQESIAPHKIVFFVDCANDERLYVSERDLTTIVSAVSIQQTPSRINNVQALQMCRNAVITTLENPDSFDQKVPSTKVSVFSDNNVEVIFDFDVKNMSGEAVYKKARCIVNKRGHWEHSPEILDR